MIGLKSPAVDAILNALVHAQTREQLVDATHALDRVLMHGYYVVPHWYSATHRVAYQARPCVSENAAAVLFGGRLDHVDVVVRAAAVAATALRSRKHSLSRANAHHSPLRPETPPCGATSSNACC